jgi:homoserine dehydrogenase
MLEPVGVGICGLGTVGQGTLHVLARNAGEIARRAGRTLRVVRTASRSERGRAAAGDVPFSRDVFDVVRDPAVAVVAELIGGTDTARELVLAAIAHGRHVVTANKALIARHGDEIFAAARARGVAVAFEAAVAGGIPIIKAIREGLAGNRIARVVGIINGTSNFILSAMEDGADFAAALAEAQRLGYAEADPSFDIDGVDAAHKLTILCSTAFGVPLRFDSAYTEGIGTIERDDVEYARQLGYRIRQLGITRRRDDGVELRVHPVLVSSGHLLASVRGAMNAVLVESDAAGETVFYGAGAGGEPTASAVVADLVDISRTLAAGAGSRVPALAFQPEALEDLPRLPVEEVESAYYLRIPCLDRPGVLAQIARILSEQAISIESVIQKEQAVQREAGEAWVPVIILTQRVRERAIDRAIAAIAALADIRGRIRRIRVESFR